MEEGWKKGHGSWVELELPREGNAVLIITRLNRERIRAGDERGGDDRKGPGEGGRTKMTQEGKGRDNELKQT